MVVYFEAEAALFGTKIGYLITGYCQTNGVRWQYSMMGQGVALVVAAVILLLTPAAYVNLQSPSPVLPLTRSSSRLISEAAAAQRASMRRSDDRRPTMQSSEGDEERSSIPIDHDPRLPNEDGYESAILDKNIKDHAADQGGAAPAPYWRIKTMMSTNKKIEGVSVAPLSSSHNDHGGRLSSATTGDNNDGTAGKTARRGSFFSQRSFRTFVTTSPAGFVYEGYDMRLQSARNEIAFESGDKLNSIREGDEENVSNISSISNGRRRRTSLQPETKKTCSSGCWKLLQDICRLLTNTMYISLVISLSTLFYCVTGE